MEGAINMKNNKAYCFECKYCIVQGAYAPKECLKTRVNEDSPLVQRATYTECEVKNKNNDCNEFEQTNCFIRLVNEFKYTQIGY